MDSLYKEQMLTHAESCFGLLLARRKDKLAELSRLKNHDLNPLLDVHKAMYIFGTDTALDMAKALIIPSIIGTGLNTSFGNIIQKDYLLKFDNVTASSTDGMDIEFRHAGTSERIYCQLKAGINTINHGDVTPIINKFTKAIRLIQQNGGGNLPAQNFIVGVFSGEYEDRNGNYKKIEDNSNHPVLVGKDFWQAITGDAGFYDDLASRLQHFQRANSNFTAEFEQAATRLADDLKEFLG